MFDFFFQLTARIAMCVCATGASYRLRTGTPCRFHRIWSGTADVSCAASVTSIWTRTARPASSRKDGFTVGEIISSKPQCGVCVYSLIGCKLLCLVTMIIHNTSKSLQLAWSCVFSWKALMNLEVCESDTSRMPGASCLYNLLGPAGRTHLLLVRTL